MKKFATLVLMLLISCCFALGGCGQKPLTMPNEYVNAVSNGGFVVGAGNYVYFANAYKDNTSISSVSENSGSKVAQHSLKRAEIETKNSSIISISRIFMSTSPIFFQGIDYCICI